MLSLREFAASVNRGRFGENDRKWFSAWLKRYAEFMRHGDGSAIALSKDSAIKFCVMLQSLPVIAEVVRQKTSFKYPKERKGNNKVRRDKRRIN